jgi:XRN 5'-3' exonuclease N-terminus
VRAGCAARSPPPPPAHADLSTPLPPPPPQISQVLKTLEPRKAVVFAFDGSAPLAKLLTQRARRQSARRAERYRMSALHITPGTACAYRAQTQPQCRRLLGFRSSSRSLP